MESFLEHDCESIDAAVFSGDCLESADTRAQLREYAERWLRAIAEREAAGDDPDGTLTLNRDTGLWE